MQRRSGCVKNGINADDDTWFGSILWLAHWTGSFCSNENDSLNLLARSEVAEPKLRSIMFFVDRRSLPRNWFTKDQVLVILRLDALNCSVQNCLFDKRICAVTLFLTVRNSPRSAVLSGARRHLAQSIFFSFISAKTPGVSHWCSALRFFITTVFLHASFIWPKVRTKLSYAVALLLSRMKEFQSKLAVCLSNFFYLRWWQYEYDPIVKCWIWLIDPQRSSDLLISA